MKTLVLTHIPPDIDTAELRARMLDEMSGIFEGRVVWGEDLMELTLVGENDRIAGAGDSRAS